MAQDTPPSPVKAQKSQREIGYAATPTNGSGWWNVDVSDAEQTPEMRWPDCLPVYDAMVRSDSQVGSVMRAVTHPVRSTGWRIDPNGARDEVVQMIAQDLGLQIRGSNDPLPGRTRDRFNWSEHLRLALLKLRYGHMPFEQLYRIEDGTGYARLRKLGPRFPRTIEAFDTARDGGLNSIKQKDVSKPIPISRLVVHVNEWEGKWYGQSVLRTAYKNWLLKDRLLRTHTQAVDRNGMGIPWYTGAPDERDLNPGRQLAEEIRAGDNSGGAGPQGSKMELLGVQGQTMDALPGVKYHDEQIGRAVLAHVLNLGQQTGSWALGTTFADIFVGSLDAIAQDIADVTTAHVIEDLVDLNFGIDENAPRLVYDEIGSQTAAMAVAIKQLVDAGVLTPDEGIEAHIRLGLGLPAATGSDNPAPDGQNGA